MVIQFLILGDYMPIEGEIIEKLKTGLGLEWNETTILIQSLTHSSYAHENRHLHLEHNQRLEFLGDAVLELAVSDYLYNNYPTFPEGVLTKMRAGIVCEGSLATVARSLRLGDYLLMGKGEERSGGRQRPSILADAMESIIGAIYLDQGMKKATAFIMDKLGPIIKDVAQTGGISADFKTQLQELVQQKSENYLRYQIIEEYGPDHSKTFVAAVNYQGVQWGRGMGRTKKEAEQAAARSALEKIESGEVVLDNE